MTWTDEAGGVHPSVGDTVTPEGIEHLYSCAICRNAPAANQPGRGISFKAGDHAEDCTCRYSQEHGFIVGASCVKLWAGDAMKALAPMIRTQEGGPHGT